MGYGGLWVGVSMAHAENLVQDILGNFQCELSKPYLFYRNKGVVNGIWFFEPSECEAIAQLVQVSAMLLWSTFPNPNPNPNPYPNPNPNPTLTPTLTLTLTLNPNPKP